MANFAKNLISLRKSRNLTQQQVATYVGIDFEEYQKLEFEMSTPDLPTINKFATYYGVDPIDLATGVIAGGAANTGTNTNTNEQSNKGKATSDDLQRFISTESNNVSPKSRACAAVLAWFLGYFGIHNFYLGKTGSGVTQLVLTLTVFGAVISVIWAFVDFIMALCGSLKDKDGREVKRW